MIKKIDHKKMGSGDRGWLKSIFHFSFAEYRNPDNINFGVLRVLNDDTVQPRSGFDTHPHRDMEIISYVISGELTHGDNMGNKRTLGRGDVQYMSAGTGITHSEMNNAGGPLRFLQIWIIPDGQGYRPRYGDKRLPWDERIGKWLHIVSPETGTAPIKIHQDADIYVTELAGGRELSLPLEKNRQAYIVVIEGAAEINGAEISERDAAEITDEDIKITALPKAHIIAVTMPKE